MRYKFLIPKTNKKFNEDNSYNLRLILIDLDDDRVPATALPLVQLSPTVLSISILLFVFYLS